MLENTSHLLAFALFVGIVAGGSAVAIANHLASRSREAIQIALSDHKPQTSDAATACLEMGHLAFKNRTEGPPDPGDDFVALAAKINNILGALNAVEQGVHKVMDPELYRQLSLDEVLAKHTSICRRILKQETLHPIQYVRPTQQLELPVPQITWIETTQDVVDMVTMMAENINLKTASSYEPALAIDSEGPLALLQVLVVQNNQAFFIDVPKLGKAAFHTPAGTAQGDITFSTFLEASNVLKLFWDCRGDGAKLRDIGGVAVDGVYDVQLMDLATLTKPKDRARIRALGHAGPQRLRSSINHDTHEDWTTHKLFGRLAFSLGNDKVQALYDRTGGDYKAANKILADELEEFGQNALFTRKLNDNGNWTGTFVIKKPEWTESIYSRRPLPAYLTRYAVNDVRFLPALYKYYVGHRFWNDAWAKRVWEVSAERLSMSDDLAEAKVVLKHAPESGEELKASDEVAKKRFAMKYWPATEWAEIVQVDRFAA